MRNVKHITMKVIFYRYNNFDNSKCKRKFPYEGKSTVHKKLNKITQK